MTVSATFAADTSSVPRARRFVLAQVPDLEGELCDAVAVMVSELATNCVRYAHSDFTVSVARSDGTLRIEVSDQGDGVPRLRAPDPQETTGRGLQIVDRLAGGWGVSSGNGKGTTVWFTVRIPGDLAASPPTGAPCDAGDGGTATPL